MRSSLVRAGITLREVRCQGTHCRKITSGKQSAKPYYGFCYFEGRIVKDPREFPTLAIIHQRWGRGLSAHSIMKELDQKKIRSREGKQWSWAAVNNILKRFETKKIILKGKSYEFR
ncbi:MAG TPA: recombinase family protein [Pseudobdellovibrionaceae bacterium]